ncbi:hypothetical protein [Modestobacter versicolor]|uniref:DUF4352 domain-containing protein n=1 Tax=Modestobacter versicolor TaxID=429133 RepID=A0A323VGR4_9ACTN|nr:hypothetical protein [Modestobacter versicolor]MBB3678252.1 hypothetical protein [Modestobacter versicolor]PZA23213.1 hypothetical protein DMO24_01260 [Modestobacter versicolor]
MRKVGSLIAGGALVAGIVAGTGGAAQAASPLNPVGNMDGFSYDGRLVVSGWTFDPETAASIDVHAYVDGQLAAVATANGSRPDVAGVYPSYGPSHGWSFDLGKRSAGVHQVCVYAINVGGGDTNPVLGCRTFTVGGSAALNPVGNLEQVALIPEGLYLQGWTLDPETAASIDVHAYVDGQLAGVATANDHRPDVGSLYPSYGAQHGFRTVVTPPVPGVHRVCVYAINVGDGTTNPSLGCRSFTVSSFNFGATATLSSGIAVTVQKPSRVTVSNTASPSPSAGYSGVLFSITFTNKTGRTFTPYDDVLLVSGPTGRQAPLTFDSGGSDPDNWFNGSIPPGQSQTATFLFQVPTAELSQLRLEVNPDFFEDESAFFAGSA